MRALGGLTTRERPQRMRAILPAGLNISRWLFFWPWTQFNSGYGVIDRAYCDNGQNYPVSLSATALRIKHSAFGSGQIFPDRRTTLVRLHMMPQDPEGAAVMAGAMRIGYFCVRASRSSPPLSGLLLARVRDPLGVEEPPDDRRVHCEPGVEELVLHLARRPARHRRAEAERVVHRVRLDPPHHGAACAGAQSTADAGAARLPVPAARIVGGPARGALDGALRARARRACGHLSLVQGLASTRGGGRIGPSHAVQLHCGLPLQNWFAKRVMRGVVLARTVGLVGFPATRPLLAVQPVVCAVRPTFKSAVGALRPHAACALVQGAHGVIAPSVPKAAPSSVADAATRELAERKRFIRSRRSTYCQIAVFLRLDPIGLGVARKWSVRPLAFMASGFPINAPLFAACEWDDGGASSRVSRLLAVLARTGGMRAPARCRPRRAGARGLARCEALHAPRGGLGRGLFRGARVTFIAGSGVAVRSRILCLRPPA